jgi:integrase
LICSQGEFANEYGHSEKPTVRGGRAKNAEYRQREYLKEPEIDKLMSSAGEGRNPVRDRLPILMAFRHALRVSELVDLRTYVLPLVHYQHRHASVH